MYQMEMEWTRKDKPCLNHWYRLRTGDLDFIKILKDYHSPETGDTYYKIVTYYDGDIIAVGLSLVQARQYIKDHTRKLVL